MAKTKKPKKGDGAKVAVLWASYRIGKRAMWLNHYTIRYLRKDAKDAYLREWNEERRAKELRDYGKTWVVRKVIIQLAD